MGLSVTLSEAIIAIASVILASVFSAYAIYAGAVLQGNVVQNLGSIKRNMYTRVEIVYATIDETTDPNHFVICVKNVGTIPISRYDDLDVYAGEYGKAELYRYSDYAEPGSGFFNLTDADGDGVWEVGETAVIRAYPKEQANCSLYEVKVVPFRGIPSTYLFSKP